MASITIREQDLTTATNPNTTANIVYVPGYATMGPTNVPTLCSNVAEFQSIFGYLPYQFKNNAVGPDGSNVAYERDDYEKSYRYALELLKAGLPIYFERFTSSELPFATTKIMFDTKEYVTGVNLDKVEYDTDLVINNLEEGPATFTISLKTPFTSENLKMVDKTLNIIIGTYAFKHKETTSDEDTKFTFTCKSIEGDLTATVTDENLILEIPVENITKEDFADIKTAKLDYVVEAKQLNIKSSPNKGNLVWKVYDNEDQYICSADAELNGTELTYTFTIEGIEFNGIGVVQTADVENTSEDTNYIKLRAKYQGSYAANCLTVSARVTTRDRVDYATLTALFKVNNTLTPESTTISFNKDDKNYYKSVENSYFDIVEVNIDKSLIENNLIRVKEVEDKVFEYDAGLVEEEFDLDKFYKALPTMFENIKDRAEYTIKFITAGGYPVFWNTDSNLVTTMLLAAADRGDAIALVDPIDITPTELYKVVAERISVPMTSALGEDTRKYGAMFTPWAKYQMQTVDEIETFPGSFAYLKCLAVSTQTNADWLAISGVTRGLVPNLLELNQRVTGAVADQLQERRGISINPIMNIKPYGYCVWGNRTLFNNLDDLTASSFLNIKVLTSNIKKVLYTAAKRLTFELNSDILWLNFKAAIEPTLEQMKSSSGIRDYKITKVATNQKATLAAKIRIYPIEAIEDWDITVELSDTTTSIE